MLLSWDVRLLQPMTAMAAMTRDVGDLLARYRLAGQLSLTDNERAPRINPFGVNGRDGGALPGEREAPE